MAFKNDEDRGLARRLCEKGESIDEVLKALGGRCKRPDIYQLRHELGITGAKRTPRANSKKLRAQNSALVSPGGGAEPEESGDSFLEGLRLRKKKLLASIASIDNLLELYKV